MTRRKFDAWGRPIFRQDTPPPELRSAEDIRVIGRPPPTRIRFNNRLSYQEEAIRREVCNDGPPVLEYSTVGVVRGTFRQTYKLPKEKKRG